MGVASPCVPRPCGFFYIRRALGAEVRKAFYAIQCEIVCEDGILNLPKPATIEVVAGNQRGNEIDVDCSTRFVDAYNIEFQEWINSCRAGRVDGPSAWDGYCAQIAVAAAVRACETQTPQDVVYDEMPAF